MTYHGNLTAPSIREGIDAHADTLRRVFEEAGHGLAEHFWRKAHLPGTDFGAMVHSRMVAKISEASQQFRVAELEGAPVGGVLSYDKEDRPDDPGDAGPMLRALILAENDLVATHYINALAVFAGARGRGIGAALIEDVAAEARQPLSLIVADGNPGALRFYRRLGFEEVGRHAMNAEGWAPNGAHWISMIRKR